MCCLRGANKSFMYNLEEVQSSNSYCWWNMVTESNVSTQAYTAPVTLMNRRQGSRPVSVLLSSISILTKNNIYSASIITLLSKQHTLQNTSGVVITAVENKI